MKLTRASSYALQAVAYMANQKKGKEDRPIPSHTIADERNIPERFLLKVLKPLVSAQILLSIKGPNGGYRLARQASDISILDVVEAVDGPIRGAAPLNPGQSDHGLHRRLDLVCSQIADQVRKHLARVKVSELATR
jgi:Rrf2 family protein